MMTQATIKMLAKKSFRQREEIQIENQIKEYEKQKESSTGPHTIQWKPSVRNWSRLIPSVSNSPSWVQYPNACLITVDPHASISDKYLTLSFDIAWQPPAEIKSDSPQHLHPFQDGFSFECEPVSSELKLISYSPDVPNKEVRFTSESSIHVSPEIELAAGPVHGELTMGLVRFSSSHASSQRTKAIEISHSAMCGQGFKIDAKLTYCNISHTESVPYDIDDPSKSMQRTKGLIFGSDYLLKTPPSATSAFKTNVKGIFLLPAKYEISHLKFNLVIGHRTTSMEIKKRVRGHRLTCCGLFKRELQIFVERPSKNLTCQITSSNSANDKTSVVHRIHQSRLRTNLFCCAIENTLDKNSNPIKDEKLAGERLGKLA